MSGKKDLEARFLEFARAKALFPAGARVLAAVSGGPDSMVMLHCLVGTARALELAGVVVAHLDHGLRKESGSDARFVESSAEALGLDFRTEKADVRSLARAEGRTLEEAARTTRYEFLARVASEEGCGRIATGHTATDQAETVLMRMVRGTGPLGLAGIAPSRPDGVVRPLLCATREQVLEFAASRGIEWVEDRSNLDKRYLRNRIRHDLMPVLLELNPRLEFVLSALAESAGELASLVTSQARSMVEEAGPDAVVVRRERIESSHPELLPYAVIQAFADLTGAPLGLSRSHVDAVLRMVRAGSGREYHLPRGVTARSTREGLFMYKGEPVRR